MLLADGLIGANLYIALEMDTILGSGVTKADDLIEKLVQADIHAHANTHIGIVVMNEPTIMKGITDCAHAACSTEHGCWVYCVTLSYPHCTADQDAEELEGKCGRVSTADAAADVTAP